MHSKERPKQFLEMYNKPIIIHTLEHFEKHKDIDAIVVVRINGWIQYLKRFVIQIPNRKSEISCSGRYNRTVVYLQWIKSGKRDSRK